LVAVLVLMFAATYIVWRSSEATATPGALPIQIETLAQLSGF
jgi:hypothetical protein